MATTRQIEIYRLAKDVCLGNGHVQKTFLHRTTEGVLTAVSEFPGNTDYEEPGPRSSDNPVSPAGGTQVYATWQPLRMRGGTQDAGDTPAARFWSGKSEVQFPAIDDNFNQLTITDDDFITDDQGFRYNIENPILSPDGAFWIAILDKVR